MCALNILGSKTPNDVNLFMNFERTLKESLESSIKSFVLELTSFVGRAVMVHFLKEMT